MPKLHTSCLLYETCRLNVTIVISKINLWTLRYYEILKTWRTFVTDYIHSVVVFSYQSILKAKGFDTFIMINGIKQPTKPQFQNRHNENDVNAFLTTVNTQEKEYDFKHLHYRAILTSLIKSPRAIHFGRGIYEHLLWKYRKWFNTFLLYDHISPT